MKRGEEVVVSVEVAGAFCSATAVLPVFKCDLSLSVCGGVLVQCGLPACQFVVVMQVCFHSLGVERNTMDRFDQH